jgi:hypothetical protein
LTDKKVAAKLERDFLDSLRSLIEAEARSRSGLITKAKQSEANLARRVMSRCQTDLMNFYLSRYLVSTRGIDAAIEAVESDVDEDAGPEASHDSAGSEWSDA